MQIGCCHYRFVALGPRAKTPAIGKVECQLGAEPRITRISRMNSRVIGTPGCRSLRPASIPTLGRGGSGLDRGMKKCCRLPDHESPGSARSFIRVNPCDPWLPYFEAEGLLRFLRCLGVTPPSPSRGHL